MSPTLSEITNDGAPAGRAVAPAPAAAPVLVPWLRAQSLNANRHAAALRPFRREEFEAGVATPSEGHLLAVNQLMATLQKPLLLLTAKIGESARAAVAEPTTGRLQSMLRLKTKTHDVVRSVEKIWDFYLELFGQRQSRFGEWLVSCDRIALDCYQDAFVGIGVAKSVPAPPPFAYMRTGFSPATFRRGIVIRKLGQINPFPLVQLPYHRLVNPWTLGAVLHEVSHNLQSDLGLSYAVPKAIASRLLKEGLGSFVARAWTRWNRETFADLCGLLLGGPAIVASLMDVVGRSPEATYLYLPKGPHPTPYLRALLNMELLRRMGFEEQARAYRRAWVALYPNPGSGSIPRPLLDTFAEASRLVVDTVCYRKYEELGGRALAEVIRFAPKEQSMIEEAAGRLAAGTDPGIVPERFLIGAARIAVDRKLAKPGAIAINFYRELARR